MKNSKFKISKLCAALFIFNFAFLILNGSAANVYLIETNFTGRVVNRDVHVRLRTQGAGTLPSPVFGTPATWHSTNGLTGTNTLLAGTYLVDIDQIAKTFVMPVPDTTNTYNAWDLINNGTSMDGPWPGLAAGDNTTLVTNYAGGFPIITINSAAGSGSGNVSGPNSATVGHLATYNNANGQHIADSGFSTASFDASGAATAATDALHATVKNEINDAAGIAFDDAVFAATNAPTIFNPSISGLASFDSSVSMPGELTVGDFVANSTSTVNGDLQVSGIINGNLYSSSVTLSTFTGSSSNLVFSDINGALFNVSVGSGLTYNPVTKTLSAPTGGSGTVTSVNVAQQGFSSSGAVTGSGTITLTQNADKNHLGLSETNINKLAASGGVILGKTAATDLAATNVFQADTTAMAKALQLSTNGGLYLGTNLFFNDWAISRTADPRGIVFTNSTFSTCLLWATNGQLFLNGVPLLGATSLVANQFVITDSTGSNLVSTLNAQSVGLTNTISWTHEGTTTNITAAFNGTLQTFTCTNGPSLGTNYFFHYAGANGSVSYRFVGAMAYNTLTFDYQPKWLTGSNSVITNGVLTLTSYGGTNATQLEAAMRENQ